MLKLTLRWKPGKVGNGPGKTNSNPFDAHGSPIRFLSTLETAVNLTRVSNHHVLAKLMTPHKKALLSEYFTVGWNVIEGIVAIAAGVIAGSIALVGFGLDSYIEVASGLVLIWRLRKHGFGNDEEEEAAEKRAIFFVGVTFLVLALYVTYESGSKLLFHEQPD